MLFSKKEIELLWVFVEHYSQSDIQLQFQRNVEKLSKRYANRIYFNTPTENPVQVLLLLAVLC